MQKKDEWYSKLGKKDYSLIEKLVDEEDKKLLYHARTIDCIDRVIGPIESLLQLYGTPTLQVIGTALEILELGVLKAPFIYQYLKKTKDYDALYSWLPREIFAVCMPFGDFIDISKAYHNRARSYFEKQIIQEKIQEERITNNVMKHNNIMKDERKNDKKRETINSYLS